MTHHVYFSHFGHAGEIIIALKLGWNHVAKWSFIDVQRRQTEACSPGLRALKDKLLVRADVSGYFGYHWINESILLPTPQSARACSSQSRRRGNRSGDSYQNAPARCRHRFLFHGPADPVAGTPAMARAPRIH